MTDEQMERKKYLVTDIKHNVKRMGISTAKGTAMVVGGIAAGAVTSQIVGVFGIDVDVIKGMAIGSGVGIGNNLLAPINNRTNWGFNIENDFWYNVISLAGNIKKYFGLKSEIKEEEKRKKL